MSKSFDELSDFEKRAWNWYADLAEQAKPDSLDFRIPREDQIANRPEFLRHVVSLYQAVQAAGQRPEASPALKRYSRPRGVDRN